jgi:opacity protein-like surface antigen
MPAKKLLAAAALGVAAGAALLVPPAAAAPAASDCATYDATGSGTFRPGYESYPWSYFWSEGEETFSFCVDVPDSAEVRIEVREFDANLQDWVHAATAPAGPGDKKFEYHTDKAWGYRLYVTGISGSGTYTAGVNFSRLD